MRPLDVNDAQWKAISHPGGHLLIVAGPGTGKTHTLTYRILQFIPQLQPGQNILAVTFTNKAGQELKDRLRRHSNQAENVVTAGTFHSFCLYILRKYFAAGLPPLFEVPESEKIEAVSQELWPDRSNRERKNILEKISLWKASAYDQPEFLELQQYNKALRQRGWLDFDDLLLETVKGLKKNAEVLRDLQIQYPQIFVDEYQDINPIQHAFLKLLIGWTGTVTAIGDPNQAIYGFRGSDVKYFASFAQDFPGALTLNLSENYRSTQNLINASSQMMGGYSANVPSLTAQIYSQGRLVIHEAPTDKAEAEYVVHTIEKLLGGISMFSKDSGRVDQNDSGEYSFGDIAILFRLNSQRALLEEALNRSGIPYQINQERDYEDPEQSLVNAFKHSGGSDKVSLMTLHASKGLEFPVVFIVGCEEKLLPLEIEGLNTLREEERRLLYVGMTRAKENLFLVRAAKRRLFGQMYDTTPSSFLADIQEELKEFEKKKELKPKRRDPNADQLELFL